jgi:hypothetical protein
MYAKTMNTRTGAKKTRSRKPQWTQLRVLSVRIKPATDARLTKAVETTGRGPQDITEEALNRYFDQLDQGEQS